MKTERDLFVAIDGNAIVHRAFHAYPPTLTTSTGIQDNAVYGFTVMLLQMLKQYDPKYVFCAFDTGKPTVRHTKYAEYKGHRKPVDNSLLVQFPLVKEVLKAFNIPILEKEGYEADDILGTVANWARFGKWKSANLDMYLLTGDRDLLQLVGDNVYTVLPHGSFSSISAYNRESVYSRYGYYPEQVVDYKAIVGDASDNIPGVKGIGEKTALGLLKKYGTLENLYEHVNEVEGRYREKLVEGVEQAYFSRDLASIIQDVDIELKLEDCLLLDFQEEELLNVFKKFEFKSLISRMPKSINGEANHKGNQLDMFSGGGEKKQLDDNSMIGEVLSAAQFAACYYTGGDVATLVIVDNSKEMRIFSADVKNVFEECFMKGEGCETYFWGYEDLVSHLIQKGYSDDSSKLLNAKYFDLKLLSHLLSSGRRDYSLPSIAFEYLSMNVKEDDHHKVGQALVELVDVLRGEVKKFKLSDYAKNGVAQASKTLNEEMDNLGGVVRYIEMPVSVVLGKMENRGIMVDSEYLKELEVLLEKEISATESKIYEAVGHEFNVSSPKQLAEVIYDEIGVPQVQGNKKSRSTREEILTQISAMHPAISEVLRFRELSKVQGTYVKPYIELIKDSNEPVIHTDYKQMGASSGRFSSINPNLQNIPIKGEWGEKIRKIFIPRKGYKFVGADYSQIEFRVMTDISQDPVLLEAFKEGRDIHRLTASRILGKKEDEITNSERSLGKTINFAILFGQTQYGLAQMLKIDREVAQKYIDEYFSMYSGVKRYIDEAAKQALETGYVQSMLGRARYVAGLTSRNFNIRNAAVREAVNMPIQGTEADIMKLAMILIDRKIEENYKGEAYTLLQIHDELIFEVEDSYAEKFSKDVSEIMGNCVKLSVPLDVHISIGNNMSELK